MQQDPVGLQADQTRDREFERLLGAFQSFGETQAKRDCAGDVILSDLITIPRT